MGGRVARLRTRALPLTVQASSLARPHVAAKSDDLIFCRVEIIEKYKRVVPS